jgi:hypothetical protein
MAFPNLFRDKLSSFYAHCGIPAQIATPSYQAWQMPLKIKQRE